MEGAQPEPIEEVHDERLTRMRVGATGLAVIVIVVLLAASFSGTASNEPELTPEAIAEDAAAEGEAEQAVEAQPEDPLAELGVTPQAAPVETEGEAVTANDLADE